MIDFIYLTPFVLIFCHVIPFFILRFEKKFSAEYFVFLLINFACIFLADEEILGMILCFGCSLLLFAMGSRWKWSPIGHVFLVVYLMAISNFVYRIESIYYVGFVFCLGLVILVFSIFICKTPRKFDFLMFVDEHIKRDVVFYFLLFGMSMLIKFKISGF